MTSFLIAQVEMPIEEEPVDFCSLKNGFHKNWAGGGVTRRPALHPLAHPPFLDFKKWGSLYVYLFIYLK